MRKCKISKAEAVCAEVYTHLCADYQWPDEDSDGTGTNDVPDFLGLADKYVQGLMTEFAHSHGIFDEDEIDPFLEKMVEQKPMDPARLALLVLAQLVSMRQNGEPYA